MHFEHYFKGFISGESHTLLMFSSWTSLVRLLTLECHTLIFVFLLSFVLSFGFLYLKPKPETLEVEVLVKDMFSSSIL